MKRNKLWSLLAVSALVGTLAACGSEDDSSGSGDGGDGGDGGDAAAGAPWILGTTEAVTSIDPAGSYDFGSWNLQYNMFQQLMTVPANGTEPEPDLAESCEYDDPTDDHLQAARGCDVLQRRRAHLLGRAVLVPAQHRDRRPQRLRGAARLDQQR